MILRKVINAEQHDPYSQWAFDLECGHRLEWVKVGERFPTRKRCQACEVIDVFAEKRPGDYSILLALSRNLPQEDRAQALLGWICHYTRAEEMNRKMPGLDFRVALSLTDMGGSYPLNLDGDELENSPWC